MRSDLSRRSFLLRSGVLGCSLAASPLLTPVSFAAAPWDNRLVVLVLRGAMDGLDAVRPVSDPDFARLRPDRLQGGVALNEQYALHPALAPLLPMWKAGEFGFVNATSTPYRDQRSHFAGQDILEAGTVNHDNIRDGWLNRMLQSVPGVEAETTYAIGRTQMLITTGAAPVSNWSPDTRLLLDAHAEKHLTELTHEDPLFRDAFQHALVLASETNGDRQVKGMPGTARAVKQMTRAARGVARGGGYPALAAYAAEKLRGDARIATFSINGWDTHANQSRGIQRPLEQLAEVLVTLKQDLGPVWTRTAVIAVTEFGRTAALNGTGGTDHGTASTMIFAGGAMRGGMAHGKWPGLSEADLYERRDLLPTSDVRAHAAFVMEGLFGLDRGVLQSSIFPGLRLEGKTGLLS